MRKLAGILLACGLLSTSVFAAPIVDLFVEYDGRQERLRRIDLEATSVCAMKAQVARLFGLEMREFDLKRGDRRLRADKTLREDYIAAGNTLKVQVTDRASSQRC